MNRPIFIVEKASEIFFYGFFVSMNDAALCVFVDVCVELDRCRWTAVLRGARHARCMKVEKKSITRFNPSMLELRGFVTFDPFNFHGAVLPFTFVATS